MAAVIQSSSRQLHMPFPEPVARWFAAESSSVPLEQPTPVRPPLRVIPGGRDAALRRRQPPHVYRRRRALVAVLIAAVLLPLLALGVGQVASGTSPRTAVVDQSVDRAPVATPGSSTDASVTSSYVVQPGDSLWSIAVALRPGQDPRPLVDELARRAGPGPLEAGRRLDLTGLVHG